MLNGAFDDAEEGERRTLRDLEYLGVLSGIEVSQTSPPSMAVAVSAGLARSKQGSRLLVPSDREVDLSQTTDGDFTEPSFGNERYVAVFLRPARDASVPKGPDLYGDVVLFEQDEAYELVVVNGAEAAAGTAIPVPLDADDVLLCDVLVSNGMTEVLEADIDRQREEVALSLDGGASGFDLYRVRLVEALTLVHEKLVAIILGSGSIDAAGVLYNGVAPTWANASTVTGTSGAGNNTVAKYIAGIVGDLAGTGALARVGAPAVTVGSVTIPAGSALSHVTALASAANVNVAPSGVWGDGVYQSPAESVQDRVNGLIAKLAEQTGSGGGARFVGMRTGLGNFTGLLTVQAWLAALAENTGATTNGAYRVALYGAGLGGGFAGVTDVYGALARLRRTDAGSDGASHVAAEAKGALAGASVRAQLDELDAGWAKLDRANEFTGSQTFSSDTIVSGSGTLTVEGPTTLNGSLTTEAAVVLNAATTLGGATTISGATEVSGALTLSGATSRTASLSVSGDTATSKSRNGEIAASATLVTIDVTKDAWFWEHPEFTPTTTLTVGETGAEDGMYLDLCVYEFGDAPAQDLTVLRESPSETILTLSGTGAVHVRFVHRAGTWHWCGHSGTATIALVNP
jgi:hypothetical protein